MSTIYEFAIVKVEDRKCQIRFDLVHPDGGRYTPAEPNFYLQILIECFEYALRGYLHHISKPNKYDETYKQHCRQLAESSPIFSQLQTWRDYTFGAQIPITAAQYKEFAADSQAFEKKYNVKTQGAGGGGGEYYYYTPINERAIKDLAAIFITQVNILSEEDVEDEEEAPYWWAEVEIEVSTPELLKHIEEGMFWDSALYEY